MREADEDVVTVRDRTVRAQPGTPYAAELTRWASSGAMALTGRSDGPPLGPPAGLVGVLSQVAATIAQRLDTFGTRVRIDAMEQVVARAARGGLRRRGHVSCGGAARLIRTDDGWLAVSLPRPEDLEAVPAWLETKIASDESVWDLVARVAMSSATSTLVERATWLGLAVGALPPTAGDDDPSRPKSFPSPWMLRGRTDGVPTTSLESLVVLDLSSLWAGPLCSQLLGTGGAEVIKVESKSRPDAARRAPGRFFDFLNGGKKMVALDFRDDHEDMQVLRQLIERADVIIESTRPRALQQRGIEAEAIVASASRPKVWISITGYGRTGAEAMRVAFGDDAAVAGGLVVFDEAGPCFCADAIADPATGLFAADAALELLEDGTGGVVDVAMARVAATLSGPTIASDIDVQVVPPHASAPTDVAGELGSDTDEVVRALLS